MILILFFILIIFILINFYREKFTNEYAVNYCTTKDSLGLRLNDGSCVPFISTENTTKKSTDIRPISINGLPLQMSSEEGGEDSTSNLIVPGNENSTVQVPIDTSGCIPKNSNYGQYCEDNYGSQYGVKKVDPCAGDASKVQVTCDKMIFNEKDYNEKQTFSTQCIDKLLDFDSMCNISMPKNIQNKSYRRGYNVQSAGVREKLYGKEGDCYTNDGESDMSKARGICNLRSNHTIPRLNPFTYTNNQQINDYNVFTDCKKINNGNFVQDCAKRLSIPKKQTFAEINGFDCLPGYARAKCVDKDTIPPIDQDMLQFEKDSRSHLYTTPLLNRIFKK